MLQDSGGANLGHATKSLINKEKLSRVTEAHYEFPVS
jgi:hypothetical protein